MKYLDDELLDYLLDSTKNWINNDILEEQTKNWNYFLAISDIRKLAKEKYQIEIKIEDFDIGIIDSLIKEYENNIK